MPVSEANIPLEIFSAVVLSLILFSCCLERKKNRLSIGFIGMLASNCLALVTEALAIYMKRSLFPDGIVVALYLSSYISGYLLCFFYVNYVHACILQKQKISGIWLRVTAIGGALGILYLLVGTRLRWFFAVEAGLFLPTKYFALSMAYDVLGMALAMGMILRYRKALHTKDFIALLTLPGLMIVAIVFLNMASQLFVFTMLSCVVIYLMIQSDRIRKTALQEKRMEEMYTQLMLSQIQPHFVFNALSGIRRLIQKDQTVAVEAVEQFSMYLRTNLDSLNSSRMVVFPRELEHAREYLYLEKLRFGERLTVEYDVICDDFCLPVLTLQPIVENAVRHGIMQREEGGRLRIVTEEREDKYVVRVEDDGVGFDPEAVENDGRTHIGITNVRNRLKAQCCGELKIRSEVGKGTTVEMCLPKSSYGG